MKSSYYVFHLQWNNHAIYKRHKKLFNQKPIQRQIMESKENVSETLYNVFIYLRSDFFESVYVLAMILE